MAHRTANAHLLPVRQVSNAELRRRALDELFAEGEALNQAAFDKAVNDVVARIDPTLSEVQAAARNNGLVVEVVVEPEPIVADDVDAVNDHIAYYDSFKIGPLRKIASQAGLPNAYKGGHSKTDLVAYCVKATLERGVRV